MQKNTSVIVKELRTLEEAEECEDLQIKIWPITTNNVGFCIPIHMLVSQMDIGGLVLGAYVENQLVAFIYSVQALGDNGKPYHYSCIAGAHPDYRHQGIMETLKRKHAEIAQQQNMEKIVWTFDPLQGPNGNLNIRKLGGIVREYKINYYGNRAGGSTQNVGIPSDRFVLEWYVNSERVKKRLAGLGDTPSIDFSDREKWPLANLVEVDERNLQAIKEYDLNLSASHLLIEIPRNFEAIRKQKLRNDLDMQWRLKTREIFSVYLTKRFTVVDFVSQGHRENRRNFYLLENDFAGVSKTTK